MKNYITVFWLIIFSSIVLIAEEFPGSYTYQNGDGNRYVRGRGDILSAVPLDIDLDERPRWIVSAANEEITVIAAVMESGRVRAFRLERSSYREITGQLNVTDLGNTPPKLMLKGSTPELLVLRDFNSERRKSFTHAIETTNGFTAFQNGIHGVRIGNRILNINPLPDGRILSDESGRILLLTDPTDRYGHGVLGDKLEAGSITLIDTVPSVRVRRRITVEGNRVIEGIMPIWADVNGDETREILVTEADRVHGASLVLYSEEGEMLARGPSIGRGFRWRNQLAVAPFGPNGEMEIADSLTPHIGGPIKFFRWRGNRLEPVAETGGFTSHVIGSRNLDMAVAGDFNGDGKVELIVPDRQLRSLGAIQRQDSEARVRYRLELPATLSTNLSSIVLPDGTLGLAAGTVDNSIRVWLEIFPEADD